MFKVGQEVICKVYGEGVVSYIKEGATYQVYVVFDNDDEWDTYTKDGKLFESDDEPSLSVIEE